MGFSRARNGIDWGWFPDPWRFVRCGWVPGERRLFLFLELSVNRKTPQETAKLVEDALTFSDAPGEDSYQHDELIWCDDTPDGIVIDPVRCPLAYEEFRLKEFDRDRDGTWIDEIPDGNDHSIDAVRYAVMDDVLRGA